MDIDEFTSGRGRDPLELLIKQDLDPLSVAELELRISSLEAEIVRTRNHIEKASGHRASAEALFRK